MVPLGLFPVFAATVKLILIQMNTGECLGIGPIPSDAHGHGADKQPFIHLSSRERRSVVCRPGYYLHPNRTHCCRLCHPGHYVAQHCEREDLTPSCSPCPENSFTDRENSAEKCRGCQRCRFTLRQITLTNCSSIQDTVCGCDSNFYRTSDSSESSCLPCNPCHNGTVLKECSMSSDTVCKCHKGFFLQTQKKRCSLCSSCQGEECQDCDVVIPSRLPPDSTDLMPILACLVVVFAATILLMAVRRLIKQRVPKKLFSAFNIPGPERQPSPAGPQLPSPEVSQEERPLRPPSTKPPPNVPGVQDHHVQAAEETQIPDCPAVLYAVVDNVPFSQWKEFVRRLGLTENDIGRIQVEEWNMRDAQYKMLRHWRLQWGQRATAAQISSVLQEMELGGCWEAIREALSRQAAGATPEHISPVRAFRS